MSNDRFLRALAHEPVDATPVWLMRQAGRYLPEYRALREKAGSFLNLCQNPELACEVTLQPLRRFDLDAAILFSDILTIPEAMGLGLHFVAGEGPKFEHPVRTPEAIAKLSVPDMEETLGYVPAAVRLIRRELDGKTPLIGFAGSPWTLATYVVEGGPSKNYEHLKALMFNDPAALHQLLDVLARSVTAYLNAQIAAGAQAVQIFDTWGGVLSPANYRTFSLDYMQRIIAGLKPGPDGHVPTIVFTKGGGPWLERIADAGPSAIGLDWTIDIDDAAARVGDRVALQGNADPAILFAEPSRIRTEVADILTRFGDRPGHVFNLGHGVTPQVNPDHVAALVDAVHEFSAR
ncbi:uroporphyrinogen decarboxylase [Salinisphaera sp. Q1T1-3]|uniref:uroporphyrinogen decarboxylase n=1 Tax=Salinisphaera sp. Q1T1-3 TaxID=2321229 RepID=UPI000E73EC72|nr:uroporphyrinogen decarboxylase [Salinisphaera sp. Q1T1-3]RJS94288.1 uroporphyrinogen decarboxylase [Salinisphaera sp. Q1T1-3]